MKNCNDQVAGFERAEVRMSEDDRADIYGKAKSNRTQLKSGLVRNGSPKAVGSRTQGSYAMRTMIQNDRGDYDVDDGVYFTRDALKNEEGEDKSAPDARKMVCAALQDERFADQPDVRNNCVRVYYKNEGYHVDVPVYRENRTKDPFGTEKKSYEIAAGDDWRASDPLANTKWFKDQNKEKSPDATANGNDGQFVRIVRLVKGFAQRAEEPAKALFERFLVQRLATGRLDASSTRLPQGVQQEMAAAKIVIVGCGALGSGVARLLAQAGVEHISLVDPENLGWENIRRHELGARVVGHGKAQALAGTIRADLPMIGFVQGYRMEFSVHTGCIKWPVTASTGL